jgi:SpoU rRNA methylase family enzyme
MPQNPYVAAGIWAYGIGSLDAGKHIYVTGTPTSATITIPANSAMAFEIGTTIVVMNDLGAATNISIAITTDTLQLAGTGATGTRTLARYGVASMTKVTSTKWIISGNGLT